MCIILYPIETFFIPIKYVLLLLTVSDGIRRQKFKPSEITSKC